MEDLLVKWDYKGQNNGGDIWNLTADVCCNVNLPWRKDSGFKVLAVKRHPKGLVLIAEYNNRPVVSISLNQQAANGTRPRPWWLTPELPQGNARQEILDAAWALPDALYLKEVMPEPDMELDEIHAAQELMK